MGAPAISARGAAAPARKPRRATTPAKPRARATAPARRVSTPSKAVRGRASTARPRPKASAATARRSRITPPGGVAMLPVAAVAGTAGAVGGIANSNLVVGISRSRVWIVVLGLLLGGIVGINVWGLSMSASTSSMSMEIDELQRTNSVLETRIAQRLSSERVQQAAAAVGLDAPAADAVRYVNASPSDAENAAKRIGAGEISVLSALPIAPVLADAATVPVVEDPAAIDPATGLPIDPATGLPVDPATGLPADPAAATATTPADPAATTPVEPTTTEPTAAAPADQATSGAIGAP